MKFIKCLIKRGDYERAQKLLRGTLINADHKDCIKGNLLLADIFHNYLKTPVIAEQCYLTATFMAIPENCPRGLILLYKQQETKEAWHEELIHAYQHEWHAYCKALLLEQKKECAERYNVYPEEFLVQSLNRGETLKALETLIKKQFYTHQELTQKIAMCAGDQTFKDAALALITQSQPPSS